jgi:putative endonuclease
MSWLVYILQSEVDGDYYKGVTQNIEKRLLEHNSGESKFTSTKLPWNLVYKKLQIIKKYYN